MYVGCILEDPVKDGMVRGQPFYYYIHTNKITYTLIERSRS